MAIYLTTNFETVHTRARCTHRVRPRARGYAQDMFDWCGDQDRRGYYWVAVDSTFHFSNEQTAFEFKMRWG